MSVEADALLDKSARAISAAQKLAAGGDWEFAAGRAYYAMFYAATAILLREGLRFKKHAGVHAAFGEHFAKPGRMDANTIVGCWTPSICVSRATTDSKRWSHKKTQRR